MRTLIWFLYFWLYLVALLPFMAYARHLEKRGEQEKLDRFVAKRVQNWARRLLRVAGVTVEVRGAEKLPQGAFVVMSNHEGYFDIPIMLGHVGAPRGLVAKIELQKIPGIRTWMRYLHCLFVDRSSVKAGAQTMIDGAKLVENGYSLTVFPEGTRSKGGPVAEFKAGAFRIASKAGAPIVPITIDGSYKVMEANKMWIHPAHVVVTVHESIETQGMTREDLRTLPERVREIVASAL